MISVNGMIRVLKGETCYQRGVIHRAPLLSHGLFDQVCSNYPLNGVITLPYDINHT